jgi:hypothetical protein
MDRSTARYAIWCDQIQNDWNDESAREIAESFNDLIALHGPAAFPAEQNDEIINNRSNAEMTLKERTCLKRCVAATDPEEERDKCAQIVATLITAPATVIDLGCGAMALERALPEGITYLPADLVSRDERTILFDMNNGLFPDADADIAVALGLLEYAHDPAACMKAFARWPRLIMSYNPTDIEDGRDRLKHGWFSNLAVASLINLANEAGFSLTAMLPCPPAQRIFDFVRMA